MPDSSSGSSGSSVRRCPKCRRRMGRFSLRCLHCNYSVPYRQVYVTLIMFAIGLVGVAVMLAVKGLPGQVDPAPGPVSVGRGKK